MPDPKETWDYTMPIAVPPNFLAREGGLVGVTVLVAWKSDQEGGEDVTWAGTYKINNIGFVGDEAWVSATQTKAEDGKPLGKPTTFLFRLSDVDGFQLVPDEK